MRILNAAQVLKVIILEGFGDCYTGCCLTIAVLGSTPVHNSPQRYHKAHVESFVDITGALIIENMKLQAQI